MIVITLTRLSTLQPYLHKLKRSAKQQKLISKRKMFTQLNYQGHQKIIKTLIILH